MSARDRIRIHNLRPWVIVGVDAWEREVPQELRIDVELELDLAEAGRSDRIAATVDYDALAGELTRAARAARRHTLEALAEDLAELCLGSARVESVRLRLEKPRALALADAAVVEIHRRRGGVDG